MKSKISIKRIAPLLGFLGFLALESCLKTNEYETWYYLINESGVPLRMERHSGAEGAWDSNFQDTTDILDFASGGELGFYYPSEGAILTPFGATDSLVFTDGDSIRMVFTPKSVGRNPFWPGSYNGGFISEQDWVVYSEYRFTFTEEDLGAPVNPDAR